MSKIKMMVRGMGYLPHVGSHPGTPWLVFFLLIGLAGSLWGLVFMAAAFGPIYLWGAYDRACLNDRLEKGDSHE